MKWSSLLDSEKLEEGDFCLAEAEEQRIAFSMAFALLKERGESDCLFIENDIDLDIRCKHPYGKFKCSLDSITKDGLKVQYLNSVYTDDGLSLDVIVKDISNAKLGLYRVGSDLVAEELIPCGCSDISKSTSIAVFTVDTQLYLFDINRGIDCASSVITKRFLCKDNIKLVFNFVYLFSQLGAIYVEKQDINNGNTEVVMLTDDECIDFLSSLSDLIDFDEKSGLELFMQSIKHSYNPFNFYTSLSSIFEEV